MNFIKFLTSISLLLLAVRFQLKLFWITNNHDRILASLVLAAANIVVSALVLSQLTRISTSGYLSAQLILCAVSTLAFVFLRKKLKGSKVTCSEEACSLNSSDRFAKWILIGFFSAVLLVAFVNFILGIYVPPNNWDSMTYHLSRVAYWMQNKTLQHYYTHVPRQNFLGHNAELLILWNMIFLKQDLLAASVQWLSYCGIGLTIYRLSLTLEYSSRASLFAALVFLTLPPVLLQSSTTQNDLVVTFFAVSFYYFYYRGAKLKRMGYLCLSGLSLGLAVGTKGTIFYLAPALVLCSVILARTNRLSLATFATWIGFCAAGIIILGSYNYLQNYLHYKNPLGTREIIGYMQPENPTIKKSLANAIRYAYCATQWTGMPAGQAIQKKVSHFAQRIFSNIVTTHDKSDELFSFEVPPYFSVHEDTAWFGWLGLILLFPIVLFSFFRLIRFRSRIEMERWTFAFIPAVFFAFVCFILFYHPFNVRFFILPAAFAAPLVAASWNVKRRLLMMFVLVSIGIGIYTAFYTTAWNARKPLLGSNSIFSRSFEEMRTTFGNPKEALPIVQFIEGLTCPGARIGLVLGEDVWDYIFFGRKLSNVVIPISWKEIQNIEVKEIMEAHSLDLLVTCTGGMNPSHYSFGFLFPSNAPYCNYLVVPTYNCLGDYDGDGTIDIALYCSGRWAIQPSSNKRPYIIDLGGDPSDIPAPGDYDGDGKMDVAVYRKSTGKWYFIPSAGGPPYEVAWGGDPSDIPVPGDYDGDGKTDVAVYRSKTGDWYIRPSSGTAPYGIGWGGDASDKPVPADYDGDGKTDPAVYRSRAGDWYIRPSSGGKRYTVKWGGDVSDIPAPGDYHGDGKADLAVYRFRTGEWRIRPSSRE